MDGGNIAPMLPNNFCQPSTHCVFALYSPSAPPMAMLLRRKQAQHKIDEWAPPSGRKQNRTTIIELATDETQPSTLKCRGRGDTASQVESIDRLLLLVVRSNGAIYFPPTDKIIVVLCFQQCKQHTLRGKRGRHGKGWVECL